MLKRHVTSLDEHLFAVDYIETGREVFDFVGYLHTLQIIDISGLYVGSLNIGNARSFLKSVGEYKGLSILVIVVAVAVNSAKHEDKLVRAFFGYFLVGSNYHRSIII